MMEEEKENLLRPDLCESGRLNILTLYKLSGENWHKNNRIVTAVRSENAAGNGGTNKIIRLSNWISNRVKSSRDEYRSPPAPAATARSAASRRIPPPKGGCPKDRGVIV